MAYWKTSALFWVQLARLIPGLCNVDYLGGSLNLCTILGINTWSLRAETSQSSSVEVRLLEGGLVDKSLEKWLRV